MGYQKEYDIETASDTQDSLVPDLTTEFALGISESGVESVDSELEQGFWEKYEALLFEPDLRKIVFSVAIISGGIAGYKALRRYLAERSTGGSGETEVISDLEATQTEMAKLSQESKLTMFLDFIKTAGQGLRETAQQQDPEDDAAGSDIVASLTDQIISFLEAALDAESPAIDQEEKQSIRAALRDRSLQVAGLLRSVVDGKRVHEDAELVLQAMEDPAAFDELYHKYYYSIRRYIARRLGSVPDRDDVLNDLASEVFAKAYDAIAQGKFKLTGAPFNSFLYRIAHNRLFNWRRDVRDRTIAVGLLSHQRDYPTLVLERVHLLTPNEPEISVLEASEKELLNRAIAQLAPDRQLLLTLKFVEGLNNKQVAEIMGRSEGAIKSLYHRTLAQLRDILSDEQEQ